MFFFVLLIMILLIVMIFTEDTKDKRGICSMFVRYADKQVDLHPNNYFYKIMLVFSIFCLCFVVVLQTLFIVWIPLMLWLLYSLY